MNDVRGLLLGLFLFAIGQTAIWIQTNGQFIWKWVEKNPLLVSVLMGAPISYIFIKATKLTVTYFDGTLWPSRFIGFSIGIFCFALMTWFFRGESITMKTMVCLILSLLIITIQLFWK